MDSSLTLTVEQLDVLGASFLFRGISDVIRLLERRGEVRTFLQGETIFSRTAHRRSVGILLSGSALVQGLDGVLLNRLSASSIFGVAGIFSSRETYVKDILAERETVVLFLSEDELDAIFQESYPVCRNYIAFLSDRINFLNDKIDSFTAPDIESRLIFYLQTRAEGAPPTVEIASISELARVLHIGRASLYRVLDLLESSGKLKRSGRRITLL